VDLVKTVLYITALSGNVTEVTGKLKMVKFTLEQAMKAQMGSRAIALTFLSHLVVYMFIQNKNKLHQLFIFILHTSTLSYTLQ